MCNLGNRNVLSWNKEEYFPKLYPAARNLKIPVVVCSHFPQTTWETLSTGKRLKDNFTIEPFLEKKEGNLFIYSPLKEIRRKAGKQVYIQSLHEEPILEIIKELEKIGTAK